MKIRLKTPKSFIDGYASNSRVEAFSNPPLIKFSFFFLKEENQNNPLISRGKGVSFQVLAEIVFVANRGFSKTLVMFIVEDNLSLLN